MFHFLEWFAGLPKWLKLAVAMILLAVGWALDYEKTIAGMSLIGLGIVLLLATFCLSEPD